MRGGFNWVQDHSISNLRAALLSGGLDVEIVRSDTVHAFKLESYFQNDTQLT